MPDPTETERFVTSDTTNDAGNDHAGNDAAGNDNMSIPTERIQRAALELIHAAKRFLDVAEEAVSDPELVADAVAQTSAWAEEALAGLGRFGARRSGSAGNGPDGTGDPTTRVQPITLDD